MLSPGYLPLLSKYPHITQAFSHLPTQKATPSLPPVFLYILFLLYFIATCHITYKPISFLSSTPEYKLSEVRDFVVVTQDPQWGTP